MSNVRRPPLMCSRVTVPCCSTDCYLALQQESLLVRLESRMSMLYMRVACSASTTGHYVIWQAAGGEGLCCRPQRVPALRLLCWRRHGHEHGKTSICAKLNHPHSLYELVARCCYAVKLAIVNVLAVSISSQLDRGPVSSCLRRTVSMSRV